MLNRTQTHLNKDRKNLVNPRFALAQLSPTFKYFCLRPKIPPKLLRYFQVQLILLLQSSQNYADVRWDDKWCRQLAFRFQFIIFVISVLAIGCARYNHNNNSYSWWNWVFTCWVGYNPLYLGNNSYRNCPQQCASV